MSGYKQTQQPPSHYPAVCCLHSDRKGARLQHFKKSGGWLNEQQANKWRAFCCCCFCFCFFPFFSTGDHGVQMRFWGCLVLARGARRGRGIATSAWQGYRDVEQRARGHPDFMSDATGWGVGGV